MSPQSLTMICVVMVSVRCRWYKTQVSPPLHSPSGATAIDVRTIEPLGVDNRGQAQQDFLLFSSVSTSTTHYGTCTARDYGLYEVIGDKLTGSYYTRYSTLNPRPGFHILYQTFQILATDYNTTAVLLIRPYVNGKSDLLLSSLSILSRDATAGPDPTVVTEAFQGYCPSYSPFNRASSGYYTQLPVSGLACLTDLPGEAL